MSGPATEIESERLILRRLSPADVDNVLAYGSDPQTMIHFPRPWTREVVELLIERVSKTYASHGYGLYAIILRETGKLIGDCGLLLQEVNGRTEVELGYHFAREHWNQGYATEAAKACRDHAFGSLGLQRLISLIRPINLQSRRVAEKVGLTIEQEIIKWDLPHYVYSIDKERYAAMRMSSPSSFTS